METQQVDMKVKHCNDKRIPHEAIIKINENIESFPKKVSHYSSIPITYLKDGLKLDL